MLWRGRRLHTDNPFPIDTAKASIDKPTAIINNSIMLIIFNNLKFCTKLHNNLQKQKTPTLLRAWELDVIFISLRSSRLSFQDQELPHDSCLVQEDVS